MHGTGGRISESRCRSRAAGKTVAWILLLVLVVGAGVAASTTQGVTITLLNSTYNRPHDITEFRYRVSSAPDPSISSWVLQIPDCIEDSAVLFTSKPCRWVSEPFRGLRFDVPHVTTTYHVRLSGHWDTAATQVAVLETSVGEEEHGSLASVSGPGCLTWMSLSIVSGEVIVFPPVTGAGSFHAGSPTVLRVSCSVDGWFLDHFVDVDVPAGGDSDMVANAFSVAYEPFSSSAGTTDVAAAYALTFDPQDFSRLPSGEYRISVVYTLIAPD